MNLMEEEDHQIIHRTGMCFPFRKSEWMNNAKRVINGDIACIPFPPLACVLGKWILSKYPRFSAQVARAYLAHNSRAQQWATVQLLNTIMPQQQQPRSDEEIFCILADDNLLNTNLVEPVEPEQWRAPTVQVPTMESGHNMEPT